MFLLFVNSVLVTYISQCKYERTTQTISKHAYYLLTYTLEKPSVYQMGFTGVLIKSFTDPSSPLLFFFLRNHLAH